MGRTNFRTTFRTICTSRLTQFLRWILEKHNTHTHTLDDCSQLCLIEWIEHLLRRWIPYWFDKIWTSDRSLVDVKHNSSSSSRKAEEAGERKAKIVFVRVAARTYTQLAMPTTMYGNNWTLCVCVYVCVFRMIERAQKLSYGNIVNGGDSKIKQDKPRNERKKERTVVERVCCLMFWCRKCMWIARLLYTAE